jgi:histone chaperone ASF1
MLTRIKRWYVGVVLLVVLYSALQVSSLLSPSVVSLSCTYTYSLPSLLDLEWKVLYVGSAQDAHQDQVLDEILVGPVPVGLNKFVLQADPPNIGLLGNENILGVTVVLVTCSYQDHEFVRIGYYVNNEYVGPDADSENPPENPDLKLVQRHILADKPRVTKFPITWDGDTIVPVVQVEDNNNNKQQQDMSTPSTVEMNESMEVE